MGRELESSKPLEAEWTVVEGPTLKHTRVALHTSDREIEDVQQSASDSVLIEFESEEARCWTLLH